MTDYLRPMAAYVATQSGHRRDRDDHPGQTHPEQTATPDTPADTEDTEVDRGWTR
ncbi:hypothetical protein H0264_28920 [Nocardia huaxiensis]|uniref:Uncharacterized protein n=1 Tax=Nocardia huaxiensis TaxID=2755382 RepID=A0A7D6V8Y9_9NOCA|nr:hypothetical protein [Nocardia huaxiensis]QLY29273.1 hypothetical protein H0264_28920 [Nocardia huaxiensis]